jgi:Protein of unknown function (DUF4231)
LTDKANSASQQLGSSTESSASREAQALFYWYVDNARSSRFRYQVSEVILLVVAASVPIAGILTPGDARLPAALGAVVVMLTGLRSVFHWHDNWTRFSMACASLKAELRLYDQRVPPYDDPTRDDVLVKNVNNVELTETTQWMRLASPSSSPKPQ